MTERNLTQYHLEQSGNKIYILSTCLINDKVKLSCQEPNSQTYVGAFSIYDLYALSKYFNSTRSVEQVQKYLNGIIEKQRLEIYQDNTCIKLILHLINNDNIIIPLTQKLINNNINNYYHISNNQYINEIPNMSNITTTTNYSTNNNYYNDPQIAQSYLYQQNSNQNLNYINSQSQIYSIDQNSEGMTNIEFPSIVSNNNITHNKLASSPVISSYPQADSSNFNYQMNKLENEINTIRPEQEKMTNELKRVLDQAEQYKQENDTYKEENALLSKEIINLKTENENLKKEINDIQNNIKEYQEQYESSKNEIINLQKKLLPIQDQNEELFKLKEKYENDNQLLQQNLEKITQENDTLKSNFNQLNQNITLLSSQNESYIKEINELKNNYENVQKSSYNEEEIKKLIEEINIYRIKAQENDVLKKNIEELQFKLQQLNQIQEQKDQDQEQDFDEEDGKEVKGDIIHDMNELELLTKKINKENKKIIINLLYKASADGDKASVFHEKCDEANNTIVLVETKDGKRFGGYTTCSWRGNCIEKHDPDAFIFSFDKMKTYDNIPEDDAIGCYPKFGPIFLGCQIKIFDDAFTKGGTTFEKELNFDTKEDYELTGGSRTFDVKDIEVYEVIIEDLDNN